MLKRMIQNMLAHGVCDGDRDHQSGGGVSLTRMCLFLFDGEDDGGVFLNLSLNDDDDDDVLFQFLFHLFFYCQKYL